jgi:hypothetical protein
MKNRLEINTSREKFAIRVSSNVARSGSILESMSVIFQKSLGAERLGSVIYIYIYCVYIKKNMHKDKLAAEKMIL